MAQIWVCPLSRLDDTLRRTRAGNLVTLLARSVPLPPALPVPRHLWLDISDIAAPLDGHVLPGDGACRGAGSTSRPSGTAATRS